MISLQLGSNLSISFISAFETLALLKQFKERKNNSYILSMKFR